MSNYNKSTNFAVKDTLTSGDPEKVVSGAEIDNEFNSIASAVTSKADKVAAATANNFASLTAQGAIQDSGKSVSSFVENDDITDFLKEQDVIDVIESEFNVTGTAPVYACRAWVNFDGTGTVGIRGSGNVSSVTDLGGTGRYQVNFATAMPDSNYCVLTTSGKGERPFRPGTDTNGSNILAGSVIVEQFFGTSGAAQGDDIGYAGVSIFR